MCAIILVASDGQFRLEGEGVVDHWEAINCSYVSNLLK